MAERPDPQAGESMAAPHGTTDDHGNAHGDVHGDVHADDVHGHGGAALGPIDVMSWGAAALGVVLGLVVVLAFILAAS